MNLVNLIFGERPQQARTISSPPRDVEWREARPRPDNTSVRAWRAEADHTIRTNQGVLRAGGGQDYIIEYDDGDHAVVRADIFERTYEALGGGLYRKRADIVLRYFTLKRPAAVETLEGVQEAKPGDWIMQGVAGELWPVPREKALEKYEPV
jgi:hypothetical protein